MLSINNALQVYDFLTPADLSATLSRLTARYPDQDHGDPVYGAYSITALQQTLQRKGYRLKDMCKTSTFRGHKKSERFRKIAYSKVPHLIIIGRPHGQVDGYYHCIARAKVGDKFYFFDPDGYGSRLSSSMMLASLFQSVDLIYAIDRI